MRVTLQHGIPETGRAAAAALYWQAFGGKLGRVLGPRRRALAFVQSVMRPDQAIVALDEAGRLLGMVGYRADGCSFAGGTVEDLRAHYGVLGAGWRMPLLWALGQDAVEDGLAIDGICVAEEARGLGIGSALIAAICDEARARGYASVRLEVVDTNPRARALYARLGFAVVRETPIGALRHIFGFRTALTMVRPV